MPPVPPSLRFAASCSRTLANWSRSDSIRLSCAAMNSASAASARAVTTLYSFSSLWVRAWRIRLSMALRTEDGLVVLSFVPTDPLVNVLVEFPGR